MAVKLSATGDARASESFQGNEESDIVNCRISAAIPVHIRADGSISYDTVISVGQESPVDRQRMMRLCGMEISTRCKLTESKGNSLEHTPMLLTPFYIGVEKIPYYDTFSLSMSCEIAIIQ